MLKEKVLITGAGGALAQKVKQRLLKEGYAVVTLTTDKKRLSSTSFYWNVGKGEIDKNALQGCHHIVHLAGFSIVKPWTKENQQKMYDSRVLSAKLLLEVCQNNQLPLKSFISASAIGYYDNESHEVKQEEDPSGKDWLAQLAKDWEQAAHRFQDLGARVICMRISLLLDKDSGFLRAMLLSLKLGLGTVFGKGANALEWIHIEDAANFVSYALKKNAVRGAYNLASEDKVSQKEFLSTLKQQYAKYALIVTIPSFFLRLIFGKRKVILEGGTRISVQKLKSSGFKWKFPTLQKALKKDT